MNEKPTDIFAHRKYWAECFGPAPWLPMSRAEMDALGWDSCDIIIVTGDAYVDHPSFGMAVVGRVLEGQGFRVGIISQPDWRSADAFKELGKPNLFFGIAAGNMDSMIITTPPTESAVMTTLTPPVMCPANARTALSRFIANGPVRPTVMYPLSSAALKRVFVGWPITITGATK